MKIAIVGAGISGLSIYLCLRAHGLTENNEVILYDSRDTGKFDDRKGLPAASDYQPSTIGASLGLAPNGLKVLKRLDPEVEAEVKQTGHVMSSLKLSTARGWTIAAVPLGKPDQHGTMIGREDLWQCLRRRVPDAAIHKAKLVGVNISSNTSTLDFANGQQVEADLVIGADGVWSVVRRTILGGSDATSDNGLKPHYEGLVGVGGFVSASRLVNVPDGEMDVVFGRNGFFGYAYSSSDVGSPEHHGDKAVWWSTYTLRECPNDWRSIDVDDAKHQLISRHQSWKNDTIQNIVREVQIDNVYPTFTTPLLPTWTRHGCVLIGDAAHALQPSSGQGTSMGLEDAEALALLLAHHLKGDPGKGHLLACKQYSDLRMPRVAMVHKQAQRMAAMKSDMGVVEELMMYLFMWLIVFFRLGESYNKALYEYDLPKDVERLVAGTT